MTITSKYFSSTTTTSDIKLKQPAVAKSIPKTTSSLGTYNTAAAILLSTPRSTKTTTSKPCEPLTDFSIKSLQEEERAFRNSFKSDFQLKREQIEKENAQRAKILEQARIVQEESERVERARILHAERVQVRAERQTQKYLVQEFEEIKNSATETITKEFVRPFQWGDNFPITQTIFEYIGWRETEAVLIEKERLEIENQARAISCAEIQATFAAMTINNKDQRESLAHLINMGMHCHEFSSEPDDKLQNAVFSKSLQDSGGGSGGGSGRGNSAKIYSSENVVRIEDVMDNGKKCKQYVFVNENSQYSTGYLISYDGKSASLFKLCKLETAKLDVNFTKTLQFAQQHDQSTLRMKVNYLNKSPITQRQKVDWLFNNRYITDRQAIQKYLQIEYASDLGLAKAAVKQFEKAQNPGFVTRAVNYVCGRTPQQNKQPTSTPTTTNQATPKNQNNSPSAQPTPASPIPPIAATPEITAISPTTPIAPDIATTTTPEITPIVAPTNVGENNNQKPTTNSDVVPPTQPKHNIPAHVVQALAMQTTQNNNKPTETKNKTPDAATKNSPNHKQSTDEKPEESHAQKRRKQLVDAQEAWREKTDLQKVSQEEKNMIECMQDAMVDAKNDTTIEFAQAGLQSWEKAQHAQSDEEYAHHIKKSKDCYGAMQRKTALQSIAEQAQPINSAEIDTLLSDYKTTIDAYQEKTTSSGAQSSSNPYLDRMEKRAQALAESQEQLRTKNLPHRTYELSSQARGFMMASNMNYAAFDGGKVTNFQHCLTQEILGIIESSAGAALKHDSKSLIGQLAQYNCDLAVSAQQLNQLAHVQQAAALTDLMYIFEAYGKVLVDVGLQNQSTINFNLGVIQGTLQAMEKWKVFFIKLGCEPGQTFQELGHDCKMVGTSLLKIGAEISEFSPQAYLVDALKDAIESFNDRARIDNALAHQNKVDLRNERNLESIQNGLQIARGVIHDRMQKSMRENVTDVTEIAVDGIITGKITDGLLRLSTFIGNEALQLAEQINKNIPSSLQDATPRFATNAGELSIIAEGTGENIGSAIAAQKIANNIEQIAKNVERVKSLNEKINEFFQPNPKDVAALQKSIEPYLNSEKIFDIESLKSIEGIDQINKYKEFTNNFHPDGIAKLKPEEILHLNLCDWLEPQARKINAELKASGGLKIIDPISKAEVIIEEFDLFHSLLGEIRPGSIRDNTLGGHLPLLELRVATLEIGEIKPLKNGFFDIQIKSGSNKKLNSYFPIGTSVEQAVEMIKEGIQNIKEIQNITPIDRPGHIIYKIKNYQEQAFKLHIKKNAIQFYPTTN